MRGRLVVCHLLILTIATTSGAAPNIPAPAFNASSGFHFQHDDRAHRKYGSESWQYIGHLHTRSGRRFAFMATFFRYVIGPGSAAKESGGSAWIRNEIYPAVFAISDERDRRFVYGERVERQALGLGSAALNRLSLRVRDWSVQAVVSRKSSSGTTLFVADEGNSLALTFPARKRTLALFGGPALGAGECAQSGLRRYFEVRQPTSGILTLSGIRYVVKGSSWFVHEFAPTFPRANEIGRDFFALELDGGRDVMIYVLHCRDGSDYSSGLIVSNDGTQRALPASRSRDKRTPFFWHSDKTDAAYPDLWRFTYPGFGLDLAVSPSFPNQEIASPRTGASYWAGAVDVQDFEQNRVIGEGYAELGVRFLGDS